MRNTPRLWVLWSGQAAGNRPLRWNKREGLLFESMKDIRSYGDKFPHDLSILSVCVCFYVCDRHTHTHTHCTLTFVRQVSLITETCSEVASGFVVSSFKRAVSDTYYVQNTNCTHEKRASCCN